MPVHLYGVVPDTGPPAESDDLPGHGRRGRPLRLVPGPDLRAVVSDVDEGLRVTRDDLLTHAHVLEALVEHGPVLPVQFGTIAPDDAAVRRDVLEGQHDDLVELLAAFADVVQLTVDVAHEEDAALREVLLRDPQLVALRDQLRGRSDQASQLRLGEAVAGALEELRADDGAIVVDRLAPLARAVAENDRPGSGEVVSLALLVDRARRTAMDEAVANLRDELGPRVRVRYVGPQPPYAFLEPVATGELAWA